MNIVKQHAVADCGEFQILQIQKGGKKAEGKNIHLSKHTLEKMHAWKKYKKLE